MQEILNYVFRVTMFDGEHVDESLMNDDASNFYDYMEDANQKMYPVSLAN